MRDAVSPCNTVRAAPRKYRVSILIERSVSELQFQPLYQTEVLTCDDKELAEWMAALPARVLP